MFRPIFCNFFFQPNTCLENIAHMKKELLSDRIRKMFIFFVVFFSLEKRMGVLRVGKFMRIWRFHYK